MVSSSQPRWGLPLRIGFRFLFLYLVLFSLFTQILDGLFPIPSIDIPELGELPPFRNVVSWTAAHIFHAGTPLVYSDTGSGDRTFDWVLIFCLLMISVAGTAVWSAMDRKRPHYISLHKWFQLGLRFAVGSEFLLYGVIKLAKLQMPFPPLAKLVEPFGDFSPFSVLWFSIGSAPAYEMFVGCAEIFGAILLFFPRTATFGALVCLADAIEVFVLNMTYDVPVKLTSFHLVMMSAVLLAPELRRMASFFFTDRVTAPSTLPQLFRTTRANRIALVTQVTFAVFLTVMNGIEVRLRWYQYGGGAPKSPLYGIWNVDPGTPESHTWRRVIFDNPRFVQFQRPDDSFATFAVTVNIDAGTVTLTKPADQKWGARFDFQRVAAGEMTLSGEMDGAPLRLQLHLRERSQHMLISRGFQWVQERTFGR